MSLLGKLLSKPDENPNDWLFPQLAHAIFLITIAVTFIYDGFMAWFFVWGVSSLIFRILLLLIIYPVFAVISLLVIRFAYEATILFFRMLTVAHENKETAKNILLNETARLQETLTIKSDIGAMAQEVAKVNQYLAYFSEVMSSEHE